MSKVFIFCIFFLVASGACTSRFSQEKLQAQHEFLVADKNRASTLAEAWKNACAGEDPVSSLQEHIKTDKGRDMIRLIAAASEVATPSVEIFLKDFNGERDFCGTFIPTKEQINLYAVRQSFGPWKISRNTGLFLESLAHEMGHAADPHVTVWFYYLHWCPLLKTRTLLLETRAELNVLRVLGKLSPLSKNGRMDPLFGTKYLPFREPFRSLLRYKTKQLSSHQEFLDSCDEIKMFLSEDKIYIREAYLVVFVMYTCNQNEETAWKLLAGFDSDAQLLQYVDEILHKQPCTLWEIFEPFFLGREALYN